MEIKNNPITIKDIEVFMDRPHLFGHYLGYTDLIDIHSKWIRDAWLSKNKLSMQAHRNSYKTTSILIVGTIWYLLFFNCEATVLIIRKKDEDAQKVVSTIRNLLESQEVVCVANFLYGVQSLITDQWSKSSVNLSIKKKKTPEGNIDAKGTTTNIVGSHYDFIFPDDIISLRDRVSKAERELIKDFVRELKNIIKRPNGKIFFSGTPWHKNDAWTILPEPDVFKIGSIHIPGFMPHELEETKRELRKGNTMSLYNANYELCHTSDETRIFNDPKIGILPELKEAKRICAFLDPSYRGDNTTALSIVVEFPEQLYMTGFVWPDNVKYVYSDVKDKLLKYMCGTMFVENNADQGYSADEFRKIWPSIVEVNTRMNKHIKIVTYLLGVWDDIIIDEGCQLEWINQILDYAEGEEPDDAPDSAAALIKETALLNFDFKKVMASSGVQEMTTLEKWDVQQTRDNGPAAFDF